MSFTFARIAGTFHLELTSFDQLLRLGEVPDAHWIATAAPTGGLNCDPLFPKLLDGDANGRVRTGELREAIAWTGRMLKDRSGCVPGSDTLALAHLSEAAAGCRQAAEHLLAGLGASDRTRISLEQVRKAADVERLAGRNGDGVVGLGGVEDDASKAVIGDVLKVVPAAKDKSGEEGVDAGALDAFLAARDAALAWEGARAATLVWGADSVALARQVKAARSKFDEYFLACRMVAAQPAAAAGFTLGADRAAALLGNAAALQSALTDLPIAAPSPDGVLRWASAPRGAHYELVEGIRSKVVAVVLPAAAEGLSEEQWAGLAATADSIVAWDDQGAGHKALALGLDRLRALDADGLAGVRAACAADAAVAANLAHVADLEKLVLFQRWLFEFANNFVSMPNIYGGGKRALFDQGMLVMAGRNFNFSMLVENRGAHTGLAAEAYTYLLYVKVSGEGADFEVVVPVTAGTSDGLFVGKRGIFYTHDGKLLDAIVVHIHSSPISVKQAMIEPFTRIPRFIEARIEAWAGKANADFDSAAQSQLDSAQKAAADAKTAAVDGAAPAAPAKEGGGVDGNMLMGAGIAIGSLTAAAGAILASLAGLSLLQLFLGVAGLVAIIAAPFGVLAWLKLRKRNLAGLLEAAGWALNDRLKISRGLALYFAQRPARPAGSQLDWVDKASGLSEFESVDEEPGTKARRAFRRFLLIAALLTFGFLWAWFKGWLAPLGLDVPAALAPPPAEAAPAAEAPADPAAAPAP